MIFIWFFTVYERWTCDIHKWFIHFLHEGMGGVWRWISCWSCRLVFATIHDIFKWYASLGNKDCPVAMLFAKIAIQDAFFHGFMYKRLFRFQSGRSHGSATGLQKQDRQQGWCANTGSTGYCPWWYSNFEWKLLGAGRGFEPLTFRLWAWRATGLLHPALV